MNKRPANILKENSFAVLPAIFLILTISIHFSFGKFYMLSVDPDYFHLFNGLNLSVFNLSVDYIHHPGTTVQVIFAVSAHVVNFILPGNDIIVNALNDPEQFIHAANILMNLLTAFSILLLGFYTYKYTGNLFLALLLQLMPFVSFRLLVISGRLIPEAALIGPILLLALLIVRFLYDKNRDKNTRFYLIGFAVVGGIGVAGKLLFIPFLIIPLFLFSTSKIRFRYLFYTVIAVMVFAFPMFVHIDKSWEWISSMLMHSEKWGMGKTNFIDVNAIPGRIIQIFKIDLSFTVILGLASIQLILFYTLSAFKDLNSLKLKMRALLAVLVSIALSILIVTKHFEPHYFNPTVVFKAFVVYLMAELLIGLTNSKRYSQLISVLALVSIITIVVGQHKRLAGDVQKNKNRAELFEERAFILSKYNTIDNPLIITSHYRGSPFIESAMVAGFLMSGSLKSTFIELLTEKYPNTYFYYNWSDEFYFWDQFKDAGEFVNPQKPLYVFIGEGREANLDFIVERIKNDFPNKQIGLNLLHHFTAPDEYFYEITLVKKEIPPST